MFTAQLRLLAPSAVPGASSAPAQPPLAAVTVSLSPHNAGGPSHAGTTGVGTCTPMERGLEEEEEEQERCPRALREDRCPCHLPPAPAALLAALPNLPRG